MKTSKIAQKHNVDQKEFEQFIKDNKLKYKNGLMGMDLDDSYDISDLISQFRAELERRDAAERELKAAQEKYMQEKQAAIASMLVTSGFNFDGYTITKYSGYISGDDAVEVPREVTGLFGGRYSKAGDGLMAALVEIRRKALAELKEAAFALGCNAVIGVDFDYITLEPETASLDGKTIYLPYIVGVTANGNAVVIEKNE